MRQNVLRSLACQIRGMSRIANPSTEAKNNREACAMFISDVGLRFIQPQHRF